MRALLCGFGSPGFLYPLIFSGLVLREQRHDVLVVCGPDGADALDDATLPRFARPGSDGPSFTVPDWGNAVSVAMQLKHVQAACVDFRPDVIVASILAIGPVLAAELNDIPIVVLGQLRYLWPADETEACMLRENDAADRLWRYHETSKLYCSAREACGMPDRRWSIADFPMTGDKLLLRSVAEIEPLAERLPERIAFVGDCEWEPLSEPSDDMAWISRERAPVVYAHLGRTFGGRELWPWLLAALGNGQIRAVASTGRSDEPLPALPAHVRIGQSYAGRALLRACSAVVGSATTSAALGALRAGVPMLTAEAGGEQKLIVEMLSAVGMLRTIDGADPQGEMSEVLSSRRMRHAAVEAAAALARCASKHRVAAEILSVVGAGVRCP